MGSYYIFAYLRVANRIVSELSLVYTVGATMRRGRNLGGNLKKIGGNGEISGSLRGIST